MRSTFRLAVVLVAAAAAIGLAGCDPSPATAISSPTTIACGPSTLSAPTDWYFPAGTPKGVLWLQHGFTESKSDWGTMAVAAAAHGYVVFVPTLPTANTFGCTVENIGNNTAFLDNVAALLAARTTPTSAFGTSFTAAATKAGRPTLVVPQALVVVGHSAGAEAVAYVANKLRTSHAAAFATLKGVVLSDPVTSFVGTNTQTALTGLNPTSLPIQTIASPPYSCNSNQSGTIVAEQLLTTRAFHGVQITTGAHQDVFGTSASSLETTTCGTPQAANTSATQTLALAWLDDDVAGTHTATNYPGGSAYQALVTAGTITTLP